MSVIHAIKAHDISVNSAPEPRHGAVLLPIGFDAPGLCLAFRDLTVSVLALAAPDVVAAPLISRDFDALDLLDRLGSLNYRGRVCIHAPKLPNRQVVLRELRFAAHRKGITVEMTDAA